MKNIILCTLLICSSIKCISQIDKKFKEVIQLDYNINKLDSDKGFIHSFKILNTVVLETYPILGLSKDSISLGSSGLSSYGEYPFSIINYRIRTKKRIEIGSVNLHMSTMSQDFKIKFPHQFSKPINIIKRKISNSTLTLKTDKKWREMNILIYKDLNLKHKFSEFVQKLNIKNKKSSNKVKRKVKLLDKKNTYYFILDCTDENGVRYFYYDTELKQYHS